MNAPPSEIATLAMVCQAFYANIYPGMVYTPQLKLLPGGAGFF